MERSRVVTHAPENLRREVLTEKTKGVNLKNRGMGNKCSGMLEDTRTADGVKEGRGRQDLGSDKKRICPALMGPGDLPERR